MKTHFLFTVALLLVLQFPFFSNNLFAQAPDFVWAKKGGGTGNERSYGIAVDASGNSYVTGIFENSATFGNTTLTSIGFGDMFIAKYDALGNVLWAKQGGGYGEDYGYGIAVDISGNSYVTGYFGENTSSDTATFGSITLTRSGKEDIFIIKYDSFGNVLWAKNGGGSETDYSYGIAVDASGNSYITGLFTGSAAFGGITLTSGSFHGDMFIAKYDTSGNVLWAKKGGGFGPDLGRAIAVDASGNSYVTGYFTGSATFGNVTLANSGVTDIFIVKYDDVGNVMWAKKGGGTGGDIGYGIAIDASGNSYVTGIFYGSATFGSTLLTGSLKFNMFNVKYDALGNVLWAKQAGDRAWGIAADASGNSFVVGHFDGSITFGSTILVSSGNVDIFIVKYDASGNVLWAKKGGGTDNDRGIGIALDALGKIFVAGEFQGSATFDSFTLIESGNSDETIKIIDKHFGKLKNKPVPAYTVAQEAPITAPIKKEILGPDAENVMIGFRFPGIKTKDAQVLKMISQILYNGQAGLIDLNLNQKQAVLSASSSDLIMNDYSAHLLAGSPRQGQTLEQVQNLILSQIDLVKQGKFDDELIPAIINNNKINRMKAFESNDNRADAFVTAYIAHMDWKDYVKQDEDFAKITKADVMDVAKRYYSNNYVVTYKRTGKDPQAQKVEKPTITPVSVNRETQSVFYKNVLGTPAKEIQPVFVDYKRDIKELSLNKNIPLLYTQNKENGLFDMYYILDMGTNNDPKIGLAVNYLKYLGTDKYTAEELQKEFYKLGSSFDVFSSQDQIYVSLRGLDANFDKSLALFESLLNNPKADKKAYNDLVEGILKERADAKLNKGIILQAAMVNYAKYGPNNPFKNIVPAAELKKTSPEALVNIIKSIPTYQHRVLYYGPASTDKLVASLNAGHITPATLKPVPAEKEFKELDIKDRNVYWADYNMVQAEILFLTKSANFDKGLVPTVTLYNEYFGGNMGSIVFQELRESKALAYSANSRYRTASKKDRANYIMSYIGTQSDKLPEAMEGMQNLLNDMPAAEANFTNAQASIRNTIASERITKSNILFDYERAKKLGIDYDIRQDVYQNTNSMTFEDLKKFQNQFVKGQNQTILVIGSKDRLNFKELAKYGKVKQLTLKELFGY